MIVRLLLSSCAALYSEIKHGTKESVLRNSTISAYLHFQGLFQKETA